MPKQARRNICVNMTRTQHEDVHALAQAQGFLSISDYVRSLLERDARAHGKTLKLKERYSRARPRRDKPEGEG
jgi:Arc/MetJ-type ribon-helix-helix transcriptional regulator